MRDRIQKTIGDICYIETYDYWGNEQLEKTFITNEKFDVNYLEKVFSSLNYELEKHMFANQISASVIFSLDDRIEDVNPIPMQALDEVNKLYEEVRDKYTEFLISSILQ